VRLQNRLRFITNACLLSLWLQHVVLGFLSLRLLAVGVLLLREHVLLLVAGVGRAL
jgi:hypothetical protein